MRKHLNSRRSFIKRTGGLVAGGLAGEYWMASSRLDAAEHLTGNAIMSESLREDMQDPDIIFIGAGINSLGAALVLAKAGWRVLVLDRNRIRAARCAPWSSRCPGSGMTSER